MSVQYTSQSRGFSRSVNQWNFSSGGPSHLGSIVPECIISSIPKCIIERDIFSSWQNSHIGSLSCGVWTVMVEKANWKPIEPSLSRKIVNQKWYHIPGGLTEISAIKKDLKESLPSSLLDSLNHQRADNRSKKNYNPAACGPKTTVTERQRRRKGRGLCTRWRNKKKPQKNN